MAAAPAAVGDDGVEAEENPSLAEAQQRWDQIPEAARVDIVRRVLWICHEVMGSGDLGAGILLSALMPHFNTAASSPATVPYYDPADQFSLCQWIGLAHHGKKTAEIDAILNPYGFYTYTMNRGIERKYTMTSFNGARFVE